MAEMNIPNLNIPNQAKKAFICLVKSGHQGVLELNSVEKFNQVENKLIAYNSDNEVITSYKPDDVWGAWLEWPDKYFGNHRGQQKMGPEYFFDVVWNDWEWTEPNGSQRKKRLVNPVKSSIWCDNITTDDEVMVATVNLGYSDHYILGWVRHNRLRSQNRVKNFHYPALS